MASGTKHFLFNRPGDWINQGLADGLAAGPEGLGLEGSKGVYTSFALDTRERETVWHRMRLSAEIPGNASVRLLLYCSDSDQGPGERGETLDHWLSGPEVTGADRESFFLTYAQQVCEGQEDATLYGLQGRYLWFCLILLCCGEQLPKVRALKLEFPRIAFVDYLPQVYRDRESVNSFLTRFISVFQSLYVDLEEDIDLAPVRFDPAAAPAEFLHWLAEGLALSDSFLWSEEQLRKLLRRATALYRWKGTKAALQEVVELYTGRRPWIVEQWQTEGCQLWQRDRGTLRRLYGDSGCCFTLLLPPGEYDAESCARLLKIAEQFKPVDAVCSLVILEDAIRLGRHCYLGINSRLSGSEALVLERGTGRSGATYMAQSGTGGEV